MLCSTCIFMSDAIVSICPSAAIAWQQHVLEYRWADSTSTAKPPTYASDVGQHAKEGAVALDTVLMYRELMNSVEESKLEKEQGLIFKHFGLSTLEKCLETLGHSGV